MTNNTEKKCPKCSTGMLKTRAKRPFLVKYALFFLPIKRYRCTNCHKKSYVFGSYARKNVAWA